MFRSLIPLLLALMLLPINGKANAPPSEAAVIFSSLKDDQVFNTLAVEAIRVFEAKADIRVRQRVISTPEQSVQAIRDFADRGIQNIILVGYIHQQPLADIHRQYPWVRFTLIDGEVLGDNIRSIQFREQEAGYLVGLAAGYASRSGTVAFIGGTSIPPVERFRCGFTLGANAANPAIQVLSRYIAADAEGFRDRRQARAIAEQLIGQNADVLFAAAGIASRDVQMAAAAAGRLTIGVDSNQNAAFPGHVLTSALKRVDKVMLQVLTDLQQQKWRPGTANLGLKEEAVGWADDADNADLVGPFRDKISKAERAIISGTLAPPSMKAPECAQPGTRANSQSR